MEPNKTGQSVPPESGEKVPADPAGSLASPEDLAVPSRTSTFQPVAGNTDAPLPTVAPAPRFAPGTLVGRYRIDRLLGRGGGGEVYLAWHEGLECYRAIKTLHDSSADDPLAGARFQREVKTLAQLQHPHIAGAIDTGTDHDVLYLVMDYVEGVSLKELVNRQGPLPVDRVLRYARQICAGLEYAHRKQVVHRDIKPGNLMVNADDQIKILDLGIAQLAAGDVQELTRTGVMMGTADYVAPEQLRDARQADPRSDLYSLGCTLYCLLTGRPPFHDAPSFYEKLQAHDARTPPDLAAACPDAPRVLCDIVRRLMAKRPEDRYESAGELLTALQACEQPPPAELPASRSSRNVSSSMAKARPWMVGAAALVLAVSAAWWGAHQFRPSDSKPDSSTSSAQLEGAATSSSPAAPNDGEPTAPTPTSVTDWTLHTFPDGNQHGRLTSLDCVRYGRASSEQAGLVLQPNALVKFEGKLDQPAHWGLVWIDTRGVASVVGRAETASVQVSVPPGDEFSRLDAEEPAGDHLLLLLSLPEGAGTDNNWLRTLGGLARVEPSTLRGTSSGRPACRRVDGELLKALRLKLASAPCLLVDAFVLCIGP